MLLSAFIILCIRCYTAFIPKFLNFYDLTTIDERFEEFEGNYIIDYFRTRDDHKNFSWQMYMMIPIWEKILKKKLIIYSKIFEIVLLINLRKIKARIYIV